MPIIDFEKKMDSLLLSSTISTRIDEILSLAKEKKTIGLMLAIEDLRQIISFSFSENPQLLQAHILEGTDHLANDSFSQFLQYLFHYLLHQNLDSQYVKERLLNILTYYSDSFYYSEMINNKKEVTLWVDARTQETALIAVCRKSDTEVLERLLQALDKAFQKMDSQVQTPPALETYLLHENTVGHSALTTTLLNNNGNQATLLFNLAKKYYSDATVLGANFQRFLFQIDSKGHTLLMRAVEQNKEHLLLASLAGPRLVPIDNPKVYIQNLLLHQGREGATVLHLVIQNNREDFLEVLLKEGIYAFKEIENPGFRNFLCRGDKKRVTPFLLACATDKIQLVKKLAIFASQNDRAGQVLNLMLMSQDSEGYSGLMRAAEAGYLKAVKVILNLLISINYGVVDYDNKKIIECLKLESQGEKNVFQIAADKNYWRILEKLINSLALVDDWHDSNTQAMVLALDRKKEGEDDMVSRLYKTENLFRGQLIEENRTPTKTELKASKTRVKLAKMFLKLGLRSSREANIHAWHFIRPQSPVVEFFSAFCSKSPRYKRAINQNCLFSIESYEPLMIEDPIQLRKEALISLMAVLRQSHLESIHEVGIMRNNPSVSQREQTQLDRFNQEVLQYYDKHGVSILDALKKETAADLEVAFRSNYPYILVDSGNNLLFLNKDTIFCSSLLNSVDLMSLNPNLSHKDLKSWLESYFSRQYTLHPFDPEVLNSYPTILSGLKESIISDNTLLSQYYEGMEGKTLLSLFSLNNKAIDLSRLAEVNFFEKYGNELNFRAENFHQLFFSLPSEEKEALKRILSRYKGISIANYTHFLENEKQFLASYGSRLISLIVEFGSALSPINVFNLLIETHKQFLLHEKDLSSSDKNEIMASFLKLKNSLVAMDKGRLNASGKAALQLTVLLFPSVIRGIVNKDPLELAFPVGLIAADVALRELLTHLAHHPQVLKIFSGASANKALTIVSDTTERIPVVGSALALYGLIQSGNALATSGSSDPNRPYYAHLLMNNLVTVGTMGAETAISLPFWPVLGLFAALTTHQLIAGGSRIYNNELHLQDENNHPLLKFYLEFKLGLGIVDASIQIMVEQRKLFAALVNYLEKVESTQRFDALIAVTLPAVRRVQIRKVVRLGEKPLGCSMLPLSRQEQLYSNSPMCVSTRLEVEEKGEYLFKLFEEPKEVCHQVDAFYDDSNTNFTLLTGSESPDCSLGKKEDLFASASANDKNVAGVLLYKHFKENTQTGEKSVLILVDPKLVEKLSFTVEANKALTASLKTGAAWLPCIHNAVTCINKVKVIIAPLYSIEVNDNSKKTEINIEDDKGVITHIECLVGSSKNVMINVNENPKKTLTLAFLKENHYLVFKNDSLITENGFEAPIKNIEKLIIELSDTGWLSDIFAPKVKRLVINHLKGVSAEKKAIFDTTGYEEFAINVGQNVLIYDQSLQLFVRGELATPVLQLARHHKNKLTFYHLLKPINTWRMNVEKENLSLDRVEGGNTTISLSLQESQEKTEIIFSGTYELNRKTCFARIIMSKEAHWHYKLEINAAYSNNTDAIDLASFRMRGFNQISILTSQPEVKIVHYFLYQSETTPTLDGNFSDYRLKTSIDGWVLILQHESGSLHEETQCFLAEDATEIIIEKVRYEIAPEIASLFALGTIDNSPIKGKKLIAPLKLDSDFSETNFSFENGIYTIGNWSLVNLPSTGNIYFDEQKLPVNYIKYRSKTSKNRLPENVPASYLRGDLTEMEKSITHSKNKKTEQGSNRLNAFLVGSATVVTTAIFAGFFMLINRFRRPRGVEVEPFLGAAFALKNVEMAAAEFSEGEGNKNCDFKRPIPLALQEERMDVSRYRNAVSDSNTSFSDASFSSIACRNGVNSTIVIADYLIRHYVKQSETKNEVKKGIDTIKSVAKNNSVINCHSFYILPVSKIHGEYETSCGQRKLLLK